MGQHRVPDHAHGKIPLASSALATSRIIIDENIVIPEGMTIGFDHDEDRERGCLITDGGVVVVTK